MILEFKEGDVFRNTLEANPRYEFKIQNGQTFLNGGSGYIVLATAGGIVLNPEVPGSLDFSTSRNSANIPLI